ncbi:hypothetical protein CDSM653_02178 [Caldanaerobacter subterraneus subsp. pacificus DSM 12653]|uniref:Uncharacterized protein n=2 Tax=Thermoanaerobacteraceae TaxID=186814 RepID=A0A0F5PJF8_9THEO|nr:hypothetical protein CDSM653_02178 [Caldanaerobacter subterraneus subsp. pacificus DSM 12653]
MPQRSYIIGLNMKHLELENEADEISEEILKHLTKAE